jgi:hypothetical protein
MFKKNKHSKIMVIVTAIFCLSFTMPTVYAYWQIGSGWNIGTGWTFDESPLALPTFPPNQGNNPTPTATDTPQSSPSASPSILEQLNPVTSPNAFYFLVAVVLAIIVFVLILSKKSDTKGNKIRFNRY